MRTTLRQYAASLRLLLLLTVVLGVLYPLAVTAVAQAPGLKDKADGSLLHRGGTLVGSALIGQSFTDKDGKALVQYFQSRPGGYDPNASGASNLGPESVVDAAGAPSLLTQVCARSLAVGELEGVAGARPYCTTTGVGAVLAVFHTGPGYAGKVVRAVSVNEPCPARPFLTSYQGVVVECAAKGGDDASGQVVPVRGSAPSDPVVPADAVAASGSGLDPHISPAYAAIQVARVARARGIDTQQLRSLVDEHTAGRGLGFLGEPRVDVLALNRDLDERFPYSAS